MIRLKTALAITVTATILTGCTGLELEKAEGLEPRGSQFSKNLYSGYVGLSKAEFGEGDYRDSDNFAIRASAAAVDRPVDPEAMASRRLPTNKTAELSEARARLMAALAAGARDMAPIQAASAQVGFDCWMQEQEENRQPDHIAQCRSGFMQALLKAEAAVKPPPMAKAPPPPRMKAVTPKKMTQKFVIYFAFDSSKITPDSKRIIAQAIDAAKNLKAKSVHVSGHTDRAGPVAYNDKLSKIRAIAVADSFKGGGVPGGILGLESFGEKVNAVKTGPNVAEPRNRRVEITISN